MIPADGRSVIRDPLVSSYAGRSRCATSRTAPSTVRLPIGTCGTCRNAYRRRACDTPRATRTGPSCLAAKLPLNVDRPEREDERTIKTLRHAGAEIDEKPKRAAGRAPRAADAGALAPRRTGRRARSYRSDHHAGQSVGTRFRAQCSHARAVLGRA